MGKEIPLRVGQRVKFKQRNGNEAKGKITKISDAYRGVWYEVDSTLADGTKKVISKRAAELTRF
jgi:hypothetical protein